MVSNKWLPIDKYKIYANTDKMVITLGKGLLTFDAYSENTKLIITPDTLEITETIDYFDNLEDNVLQKIHTWKIRLELKDFLLVKEALRDSLNFYYEMVCDVAPTRVECFFNGNQIYNDVFNVGSQNFTRFLERSLKVPILKKKFGLYKFNRNYDKKKTSYDDDLPF